MAITGFTLDGRILRASSVALNLPALLATYITMIWANFGGKIFYLFQNKSNFKN